MAEEARSNGRWRRGVLMDGDGEAGRPWKTEGKAARSHRTFGRTEMAISNLKKAGRARREGRWQHGIEAQRELRQQRHSSTAPGAGLQRELDAASAQAAWVRCAHMLGGVDARVGKAHFNLDPTPELALRCRTRHGWRRPRKTCWRRTVPRHMYGSYCLICASMRCHREAPSGAGPGVREADEQPTNILPGSLRLPFICRARSRRKRSNALKPMQTKAEQMLVQVLGLVVVRLVLELAVQELVGLVMVLSLVLLVKGLEVVMLKPARLGAPRQPGSATRQGGSGRMAWRQRIANDLRHATNPDIFWNRLDTILDMIYGIDRRQTRFIKRFTEVLGFGTK